MVCKASVTVAESWQVPRRLMSTNRLVRSTRVIRALRPPAPMTRSPSQCPPAALSSASGGRRLMVAPWIQLLPLGGVRGWLHHYGFGGVVDVPRGVRVAG